MLQDQAHIQNRSGGKYEKLFKEFFLIKALRVPESVDA